MLKQYIYKASDIGLEKWPDESLRLPGIERTEDPSVADIFVVPPTLTNGSRHPQDWMFPDADSIIRRLPYFAGNESAHVFMDGSDNEPLYDLPCIFIRQNVRPWYLSRDPNTISWPWPIDDHADCIVPPADGFKFDLSFQGWMWSDCRKLSIESCRNQSRLTCDFATYPNFCGHIWETDEGLRRRSEFRRSMKESRLALCPESIPGVFPYRFYEAMSAARVPVLVGRDFVFPMADEIPYSEFSLHVESATQVGRMVWEFLQFHSDAELVQKGRMARHYWETFLHRDKWPELMTAAVLKKLEALKACA